MDSSQLLLLSYNIGKAPLKSDYVSQQLITPSLKDAISPPRFVVVGLQEISPILNGCFGDLSEYLDPILKGIEIGLDTYLQETSHHGNYIRIGLNTYGAIALVCYIYIGEGLANPVEKVLLASTGCGYLRSSLKGGVGMRVVLEKENEDTPLQFTFITAHLSANEGMIYYRNRDYLDIVTLLDFGDGYGAYNPNSHLFFLGDLNYRCTEDPFGGGGGDERGTDEQQVETTDTHDTEDVRLLVDSSLDYTKLSTIDELSLAKLNGSAFVGFSEPPIKFPPTFKFFESTQKYNRKRIPSWCDRILYLGYEDKEVIHKYSSLPNCTESDHKPVYLSIVVPNIAPKVVTEHRNLLLPRSTNDTTPINLSLARTRSYSNSLIGFYADRSIGWGLYLSTTHQGHIYSIIGGSFVVALYVIYLFFI